MDWMPPLDALGRVLVAAAVGLAVGFERERDGHPAGTRTFATVAVGSALFGVVSTLGFTEFEVVRSTTNFQVDVTRVASQVVVGIGFLGAGMIFRQGADVQNLTTAATLWTTAAMGLAAGTGEVGTALCVGALLLLLLALLPTPLRWLLARASRPHHRVRVELEAGVGPAEVRPAFDAPDVDVADWQLEKDDGRAVVVAALVGRRPGAIEVVVGRVVGHDGVRSLRVDA
jgi:putative Mg2+ transporter-C (MgtC) family protein